MMFLENYFALVQQDRGKNCQSGIAVSIEKALFLNSDKLSVRSSKGELRMG